MKAEDMENLFSPYKRIEEKRNRSVEGTGLGMSIVKQLLSLMDSKLNVKSVYGEGSEFSFEIEQTVIVDEPIGEFTENVAHEEIDVYKPLFVAPEGKVLVVDDSDMNLKVAAIHSGRTPSPRGASHLQDPVPRSGGGASKSNAVGLAEVRGLMARMERRGKRPRPRGGGAAAARLRGGGQNWYCAERTKPSPTPRREPDLLPVST